jgi:hypothetical protein
MIAGGATKPLTGLKFQQYVKDLNVVKKIQVEAHMQNMRLFFFLES